MKRLAVLFGAKAALLAGLATLAVAAGPHESQWNRFRGPNGTARARIELPLEWTAKDYHWRTRLPDVGHSSPVVWRDRLFVTCASEQDATLTVCCLDAIEGRIVWRQSIPGTKAAKYKFNSYASSTPALDGDHVFVTQACPEHYLVIALAATDGREAWRHDIGRFEAEHGFGCSPIVFEDLVIVANEQGYPEAYADPADKSERPGIAALAAGPKPSCVVGLDRKTGAVRWRAERRTATAAYSTPCIYQPKAGPPQLILSSTAHGISSLDPRTGEANWEVPRFTQRVVASPIVAGDLILASAGIGSQGKEMFAVRPGDALSGVKPQVAYQVNPPIPYVPTPVTDGRRVFLYNDQGIVTCIDAASGEVRWRERTMAKFFCSPVLVNDRLYCVSRDGEMVVLAAADQYKLLARFKLDEATHATPAVANGRMYLRTFTQVMAIGADPTAAQNWKPAAGAEKVERLRRISASTKFGHCCFWAWELELAILKQDRDLASQIASILAGLQRPDGRWGLGNAWGRLPTDFKERCPEDAETWDVAEAACALLDFEETFGDKAFRPTVLKAAAYLQTCIRRAGGKPYLPHMAECNNVLQPHSTIVAALLFSRIPEYNRLTKELHASGVAMNFFRLMPHADHRTLDPPQPGPEVNDFEKVQIGYYLHLMGDPAGMRLMDRYQTAADFNFPRAPVYLVLAYAKLKRWDKARHFAAMTKDYRPRKGYEYALRDVIDYVNETATSQGQR